MCFGSDKSLRPKAQVGSWTLSNEPSVICFLGDVVVCVNPNDTWAHTLKNFRLLIDKRDMQVQTANIVMIRKDRGKACARGDLRVECIYF